MALIENTDFSQKNQVDLASIASLFQRQKEAEMQMKAQQEQIKNSKQERSIQVMNMASNLTSTLINQKAQQQKQAAQNELFSLVSNQFPIFGAAVKVAPDKAAEAIVTAAVKSQETPKMKLQNVLRGEVPDVVKVDEQGNAYDRVTGELIKEPIKPYSQMTAPVELTDEDRTRYKNQAQAIIEGRATTTQLASLRTAGGQKLALLVAEKDPNFDFSLAPQRTALRKDYTSGQTARNITSLNTVLGHLDTLDKKIDALNNKKLKKANTVANLVKTETGDPSVVEFKATRTAVSNELGRVFQGVGAVTEEERKTLREDMDAAGSKEQLKAVVSTYLDLIRSRLDAINANWNQTMSGVKSPIPILNNKSKLVLKKFGMPYEEQSLESIFGGQ